MANINQIKEVKLRLPTWHEKQLVFFNSPASEILYAGDTRAGKSFAIRKAYIHWCARIPGLQTDIFRLHFDDVIAENMDGETSFPILLHLWEKEGLVKINQTEIHFWNESKISLEHCSDDKVMLKHQGIAKHVRTFAESCQILEHRIRALTGWVTMSEDMKSRVPDEWKGRFPKVIHATNPKGVSSSYYRKNFVDIRKPMTIEKVGQFNRQYIPAFLDDNPSENKEATIARISEAFPDEATQRSLINEDKSGISNWHTGTGEYFPEWDESRHVVKDFMPPDYWYRYRTFDWGTAEPFAVYWVAISDGEPFRDREGYERWFPRGSLIIFNEWYGCDPRDTSRGARMRNEDIAAGILSRSEINHQNVITLTDSKPFQDMGGEGIAETFSKNGVVLSLADTSRVVGWSQMRARLIGIQYDSNSNKRLPMIYFCECCKYARDYISALPRHPSESKREDAAEHGEPTHCCDAIRYGCMAHNNAVIKDRLEPFGMKIDNAVKKAVPTIKKIVHQTGQRIF